MTSLYDSQPRLVPPPIPESQTRLHSRSSSHEWLIRTKSYASKASAKSGFTLKRKLQMYNPYHPAPLRRSQISAPMNFRHVEVGREPRSFRPLELSIYMNGNHLSPILPEIVGWESADRTMSLGALERPPPPVHMRSESAQSMFTIPRKAIGSMSLHSYPVGGSSLRAYTTPESMNSGFSPTITNPLRPRPSLPNSLSSQELIAALNCEKQLPAPPQAVRLRANTMPILAEQVERVKAVIQERKELVRQLEAMNDLIAERQSLYIQSRPTSLYPTADGKSRLLQSPLSVLSNISPEQPPLPPLPLRCNPVSADKEVVRPKTAPSRPTVHIPHRSKSFDEASSAFSSATSSPPPPPPLPLFLSYQVAQPHPLRKKKSFSRSRVSSWLFPGKEESTHQHTKSMSIGSITNTPRPVTAKEGFYQCVDPTAASCHRREVSESTVRTVSTLDGPTAATSFTSTGQSEKCKEELSRTATFGQRLGQRVSRVGVAF